MKKQCNSIDKQRNYRQVKIRKDNKKAYNRKETYKQNKKYR